MNNSNRRRPLVKYKRVGGGVRTAAYHCECRNRKNQYAGPLFSDKKSVQKPRLVTVEDQEAQSRYIIEGIFAAREEGIPLKRQAVLFRSSHHTCDLEINLRRHNKPYVKHGGLKFLDAVHVKDALSILR